MKEKNEINGFDEVMSRCGVGLQDIRETKKRGSPSSVGKAHQSSAAQRNKHFSFRNSQQFLW